MRIHLNTKDHAAAHRAIYVALRTAQREGLVTPLADTDQEIPCGSRSHRVALDVKLVANGKLEGEKRHRPNSGTRGADGQEVWALTYDEWGYFLAELFRVHPDAKAGPYRDEDNFHVQTRDAYRDTCTVPR